MENIKKFQEDAKLCGSAFQIYYSKLEYSGFSGVEPILSNKIDSNIKKILESTKITKIVEDKITLKNIFKIFSNVSSYYFMLKETYNIFIKNKIDLDQQGLKLSTTSPLSHKYIIDLQETLQSITDIFEILEREFMSNKIVKYLADISNVDNLSSLAECKENYEKYIKSQEGHYVVDLYVGILDNTIKKMIGMTEGREIIKQIIKDMEELKTNTLLQNVDKKVETFNKNVNIIQRIIQKFNLIPDGPDDILEKMMSKIMDNFTTLELACNLLSRSDKKFGIIIIKKIIKNPIVHNIWTLIDRKYLEEKNLIQDKNIGINAKSLERGETLKLVKQDDKFKKMDDITIYDIYFDKKDNSKNYFYVLETLDGSNFHFLVPWSTNIKYIPAVWLQEIKNMNLTPSRRLSSYNILLNDEILNYLSPPIIEFSQISRDDIFREESYWRNLRSIILSKTAKYIKPRVDKLKKINDKKMRKIITESSDVLINSMIEQISVDNVDSHNMWSELFISYFRDIDKIKKNIKNDLIDKYQENQEIINKLSKKSLGSMEKNKIIDIIKKIIEETLEKYINRRSNIYLTIDKKSIILNSANGIRK